MKVTQVDLSGKEVKTYSSILEASREARIDERSIRKVLAGQRRVAGGFKWQSADVKAKALGSAGDLGSMSKEDLEALLKELIAKKGIKLTPSNRKLPSPYKKGNPDNILIIPDLHQPFTREGALEFCREQQERYNCGKVVFIGDILDNHFSSFHETDPDGLSAADELEIAKYRVSEWYKVFPEALVCIGNHDALAFRKASASGLSKKWIRDYSEVLNTPGWYWDMEHELHGVLFVHGTGATGEDSALKRAMNLRQPVCQGHIHTTAGIKYNASNKDLLWGFQVGCMINDQAYAMAYAKNFIKKSIIGCGVILNKGKLPIFLPMSI